MPPRLEELERRLAAVEADSDCKDFDATSWLWMLLLGIIVPAGLLIAGWLFRQGPG